jgi:hypothetical protein
VTIGRKGSSARERIPEFTRVYPAGEALTREEVYKEHIVIFEEARNSSPPPLIYRL